MSRISLTPELNLADIKAVLAQVPDPEVPVLTLDDLGIIRDVQVDAQAGEITVTLTPTYIGCPATVAIQNMVTQALLEAGYPKPIFIEQLTPAWSTEWMSDAARQKLEKYGIAPPYANADAPMRCPNCGSEDYKLISQFGATACKSLYQCNECKEPFEYFKCH